MGPELRTSRYVMAFVIACPACVGGVLLVPAILLGVSAFVFQSLLVAVAAATLLVWWGVNIWRRRHEDACALPAAGAGAGAAGLPRDR